METVKEVLVKARALIAKGWCQGAVSRSGDGTEVPHLSDLACSWCIVGAVCAVGKTSAPALDALRRVTGVRNGYLDNWNDAPERTQADVLAAFDETIARLEGAAS